MRKSQVVINQILTLKRQKKSIRKIALALEVSRNTVRRYLREHEENQPVAKPSAETEKSIKVPSWASGLNLEDIKQQVTKGVSKKQLHEELELEVSYSQFTRFVSSILPKATPAFTIPLSHEPGEKTQIDYCDGLSVIDAKTGLPKKTQFFCGVLPFSSMTFGEFTWDQKRPTFIESHERMFAYFDGVSQYVVIDNLKAGVNKAHIYDPDVNPQYCDFGNHYGFAVLPAKPQTPTGKACVEATIGAIQRDFFQKHRNTKFYSLDELNRVFRQYLDNEFNSRVMKDYGLSRIDRFEKEKSHLSPLPKKPYEFFKWTTAKVHPDCTVQVSKSYYSVPFRFIGQTLHIKCSRSSIVILDSGYEFITSHTKVMQFKQSLKDEHYPEAALQHARFSVKQAKTQGGKIGAKTKAYVEWQFDVARPLSALRRVQGVLRLESKFSKAAMEYAAGQALNFDQRKMSYFKDCAASFNKRGKKLVEANKQAPQRSSEHIHLHNR